MNSSSSDTAIVTSAVPMDTVQKESLEKILAKKYKILAKFDYRIDKAVLAGFTVTYGAWYMDASVKRELAEMIKILKPT